jgi:ABC-2 type transport system permease protein
MCRFPTAIRITTHRDALIGQILMMTRRSLMTLLRTPEAILPNLLISAFFSAGLRLCTWRHYRLCWAVTRGRLSRVYTANRHYQRITHAPAGQAMVRDVESGYFDKLLLTPISRSALLLGHILASGLIIAFQTGLIIAIATLMGLRPETGLTAIGFIMVCSLMIGMGFGGFTVGVALRTGNAAATQGASFIFFPLTFLTVTFVPMELLQVGSRLSQKSIRLHTF